MLDHDALLPAVQKLLPQYSNAELSAGIKEFEQSHPDLNNQQALQALSLALSQSKAQPAPSGKPFEGLMNQLGAH